MDVEKLVREYLDKSVHMSLATSQDNKPWVCEVHFCYDEMINLYFVSKLQTRHCQEIAKNPLVAGNIVAQHSLADSPHGIYFEGSAELIINPSHEEIERYCVRLERSSEELVKIFAGGESGMYKITVINWAAFGKFGLDANKKYELAWNGGTK